nr:MAG TPA: hypothetical protein [Caudoviricetes sp.]
MSAKSNLYFFSSKWIIIIFKSCIYARYCRTLYNFYLYFISILINISYTKNSIII